jgi:iron complex outermembrane recepter protein
MNTKLTRTIRITGILCLVFAPDSVTAQDDNEGLYEMQPFVVSTFDASNYLASEVSTGTRYAVRLQDLPFSVSLVTSEMMNDFLAFDFNDIATYTSSFSPSDGTGRFFLRGIASRSVYKNGIRGNGLYGSAFVDRIELIRGPNAAVYGQTEPSGLRNVVTKKPTWDQIGELRLTLGNDAYVRAYLAGNVPLIKEKLAVRLDLFMEESEQRSIRHWYSDQKGAYTAIRWRPGTRTSVDINVEYMDSSQANPRYQAIVVDGATGANLGLLGVHDIAGFERNKYYGHSFAGSNAFNDISAWMVDATVNHRFNQFLSVRLSYSWWDREQDITGLEGKPVINSLDRTTSPVAGRTSLLQFYEKLQNKQWVAQADLLAQFSTGAIDHKLLLTFDHTQFDLADVALANTVPALSVDAEDYDIAPRVFDIPPYLTDSFRNLLTDREIDGLLASNRSTFLNDRIIVMVGLRHDRIRETNTPRKYVSGSGDQHTVGDPVKTPTAEGTTYQTGLVLKPSETVSIYGSYSESFNPGNPQDLDFDGRPIGNQEGSGYEFGVKASLLAQRLNFTVGYFSIEKSNLPFTATNEAGQPLPPASGIGGYRVTGTQESTGIELDVTFAPTPNTLIGLAFGNNDIQWASISPDAPRQQSLVGRPPEGVPEESFALWMRHEVTDGRFAGLSLRASMRYQGNAVVDATFTDAQGNLFETPAYTLVDFGAGYRFKQGKWAHRIDINVKNLFDERYFRGPYAGFPRAFFISYETRF